jgi:superfamily II DNA or RNA helicase
MKSPEDHVIRNMSDLLASDTPPADVLSAIKHALSAYPDSGSLLLLAAQAAVFNDCPQDALIYLKRYQKIFFPTDLAHICEALALAQCGRWPNAYLIKKSLGFTNATDFFPLRMKGWVYERWFKIATWRPVGTTKASAKSKLGTPSRAAPKKPKKSTAPSPIPPAAILPVENSGPPPLPRFPARITVNYTMPEATAYALPETDDADIRDTRPFARRESLLRLSLQRSFDELLSIPMLQGVTHYWYQIETARKVLKQFRGRVLLADEVGLGKTVEAGIILKEYLARGMAKRVLILTPPSLVEQWREEMETKFGLEFITTHDPLLRRDPDLFWSNPMIIASIATARMGVHFDRVTALTADMVIVDEAHHLKDRRSKNWELVNALKKRFLLLLSATPVQNNLVELYNLLTLLKPGLFKTERDFRQSYMKPGQPRVPVNQTQLRDLMRGVMIRNTRALVDVRLPRRQAVTLRADPTAEEQTCYDELCELIRKLSAKGLKEHRLAVHHLVQAAGSSPPAVSAAIHRFIADNRLPAEWKALHRRYSAIQSGSKIAALLELLRRNPSEKKMVFVRYLETLDHLTHILEEAGLTVVSFHGRMSGPEKDGAINRFRDDATVLLSTESGGEGRNVQFCNTIVNFDLSWNPQALEQRIGRIHRIGQQREVFVFNMAVKGTIEDRILDILDTKINMFELVVGEIQSILGEMSEERGFEELIFSAWMEETDLHREAAFEKIGQEMIEARQRYTETKSLDEKLFGDDMEVL